MWASTVLNSRLQTTKWPPGRVNELLGVEGPLVGGEGQVAVGEDVVLGDDEHERCGGDAGDVVARLVARDRLHRPERDLVEPAQRDLANGG